MLQFPFAAVEWRDLRANYRPTEGVCHFDMLKRASTLPLARSSQKRGLCGLETCPKRESCGVNEVIPRSIHHPFMEPG